MSRTRRFVLAYVALALVCAMLFFALDGLDDPSRPEGRILSVDAGRRALAIARQRGYRNYEVVHVARGRKGEGAPENRWIVLLDTVPHRGLQRAVVIELDEESGKLLRIRKPLA
ncbi:MAG TPA: hypothetical protein VHW00_04445 [Thermoanaerobaculia bacterium]|nr:hypothetical protein [Thermoanaerobaculia bacterium]